VAHIFASSAGESTGATPWNGEIVNAPLSSSKLLAKTWLTIVVGVHVVLELADAAARVVTGRRTALSRVQP